MTSADYLVALSGGLWVLILAKFPWISDWFEKLDPKQKQLVNLGLLVITALAFYGPGCLGWLDKLGLPVVTCTEDGFLLVLRGFVLALVGSGATYTGVKYIVK